MELSRTIAHAWDLYKKYYKRIGHTGEKCWPKKKDFYQDSGYTKRTRIDTRVFNNANTAYGSL